MVNPESIGTAIRIARKQQGLTQAELSKRIGVSRQWLWRAERGGGGEGLDLDRVLRACRALGIEVRVTLPDGAVV